MSQSNNINAVITHHLPSTSFRHGVFALLFVWLIFVAAPARGSIPTLTNENHRLILANGFVDLEFDLDHPSIDVIKADFSGQGNYGQNLVATNSSAGTGIVMETIDTNGIIHCSSATALPITYKILQHDAAGICLRISGIQDEKNNPLAISTWTISLQANSRKFTLTTRTAISHSRPVKIIETGIYLKQWFMNGLFQHGVMQYVNGCNQTFFTTNQLHVFYTMDNHNGSVSIVPCQPSDQTAWTMQSCDVSGGVGLKMILAGSYSISNEWHKADLQSASNITLPVGAKFESTVDIYPNNYAFPVFSMTTNDTMDLRNLRTLYTAIYGSAAGVLGSFKYDGSAYPTLATPKRPYGNMYTFFDPDAWSTVATLSFSGDTYLQDQARRIVELSGSHMRHGQIPHHFVAGEPTYIAISKATQTGPNIFWVLAAIDYATGTGNETWLREHYQQMKAATDWVLNSYDPKRKLVYAGGPLFIDVFIRQGYTLDSNAMLPHLLTLMTSVAQFCGDKVTATRYAHLADVIKQGINAGLWNGQDHYVTQRNADWSIRDLIDYDGNYAAIAFGDTTNAQRIASIYQRLDGGLHTHPGSRGTWTSEKYYGTNDCRGGNTGDSATAMARIWWLDMYSRYVTGDLTNFYRYFEPIQDDLIKNTWLTERYNAKGQPIRAPYYHEYPEIAAMILREMVYGINVKINRVRIKPFGLDHYHYQVGDLDVSYSKKMVSLHIPGESDRIYEIYGLLSNADYTLSTGQKVTADSNGTVVFQALAGQTIILKLSSYPSDKDAGYLPQVMSSHPLQNLIQYVNPFCGTTAGGGLYPGATAPFGMIQWSPDTGKRQNLSGYNYQDKTIFGFSLDHLSGGGAWYAGNFGFMPILSMGRLSAVSTNRYALNTSFSHDHEVAQPGYYGVTLSNGIKVELTATTRTGFGRFTFPTGSNASMVINAGSNITGVTNALVQIDPATHSISGSATGGRFLGHPNVCTVYFYAVFDRPFSSWGTWSDQKLLKLQTNGVGKTAGAYLQFSFSKEHTILARVAISYVSAENARANLEAGNSIASISSKDFDQVVRNASHEWNTWLNRVQVSGEATADRTTFYSMFYHTLLGPTICSDANGDYLGYDGKVHTTMAGHAQYAYFSGWDIYRSECQFLAMIAPEQASDMAQSLLADYQQSGAFPRWGLATRDSGGMDGDPAAPIIAGSYAFGATNFDVKSTLAGLVRAATDPSVMARQTQIFERDSLADYLKLGYVPEDQHGIWGGYGNVSMTLEYASADFAVSQLADKLGDTTNSTKLLQQSQNWKNLYNHNTDYLQMRRRDGTWSPEFTNNVLTYDHNQAYQEGTAAQYVWMVPFNLKGLADAMGGTGVAAERLDTFFTQLNAGMRSPFAYMGNEPCSETPWIYCFLGQPYKTQKIVRRIIAELYSSAPAGYPGNDDLGELSSWYVFSALGMYPEIPGSDVLVLGSPLFPKIVLHLKHGDVTIDAKSAAKDDPYVQSLKLNGQVWDKPWIRFSDISHGGKLDYKLGANPNRNWGDNPTNAPPSYN